MYYELGLDVVAALPFNSNMVTHEKQRTMESMCVVTRLYAYLFTLPQQRFYIDDEHNGSIQSQQL